MENLYEQYHTLREKRLKVQREADDLEQQEKDIMYELTKGLSDKSHKNCADGYTFQAVRKEVATARDWSAILLFVKETGAIDLLQKRLTESAVKLRWDAGVEVPGVELTHKYAVTITKD